MKFKNVLAMLLISLMLLTLCACKKGNDDPEPTTVPPTTNVGIDEGVVNQTAFLGDNLYITDIGNYTGIYMEDGSDEYVSKVMMVVLKNEGENALQLARIKLQYSDFTAEFEVTNLPAGESVVLLEKNRREFTGGSYLNAKTENVVFFQSVMSLQEDRVKLTGQNGSIVVENLTDETLGEIYIYYKNSAADLFYGGITYRAKVDAGLKPGKETTVMTRHFYPKACTIIDVQILPAE